MTPKKTLGEFIIDNQNQFEYSTGELSRLLNAIRLASKAVNHEVNKAGLVDIIGATNQINHSDETQQKLDVFANHAFKRALINREGFRFSMKNKECRTSKLNILFDLTSSFSKTYDTKK